MVQVNNKSGKMYVTHINVRQSIFFLVLKLIFLDIMTAVLAIFYFSLVSAEFVSEILSGKIQLYNILFILGLAFLRIILVIIITLRWINERYEIWPDAVMHKCGFIFRKQEKHPFSQMKSVKVEQGFFGKFFGFGTISFYNWYLETDTSLYLIHNPIRYFHIIESLIPKTERERDIFLDDVRMKGS